MIKHTHDFVEGVKGIDQTLVCRLCNKRIIKGKKTPNGASGNQRIFTGKRLDKYNKQLETSKK